MTPRLQGEHHPDGWLDLSLWGAGRLARLRLTPIVGPFRYVPNAVESSAGAGFHAARSAPVLAMTGSRLLRVHPARRCAAWGETIAPAPIRRSPERWSVDLPWGCLRAEQRGPDLIVAAGVDETEAERGLALTVEAVVAEARSYADACDRLPEADPLLRSLVLQGAHAAWSSVRRDAAGAFAGLSAGLAYSAPARTYFRDGYWTLPMLAMLEPDALTAQVALLAGAVRPDGEAPSGVIAPGSQADAWEAARRTLTNVHARPGEWWSDHFDSPLLFVLAVDLAGNEVLTERCWPIVEAVFKRYGELCDEHGLPMKPRNDRDWADNVYREGAVAYDAGLWAGALAVVERLGRERAPAVARQAGAALERLRAGLERLWRTDGWYADYATPGGFVEGHLTLDSLMLLRFGAVPEARAGAVLDAAALTLETRRNAAQRWGDWGVMCAWPPYARRADLRAKTAFAGRYHNGGDWPWLDGVYADELLRRGRGGWRYPLMRWWKTCLAKGWTSPVEWFSPPFGRGSLLQAWSSLPAAVALAHRDAVLAGDPLA